MSNPPAFPASDNAAFKAITGMTLRDYFAAAALQGMWANPDCGVSAEKAYKEADEMLRERNK